MGNYILSCCSTADLTKEHFESRDINYVCFHFAIDGVEHIDDLGQSMPFLPGIMQLRTVHNYGAAWSSFSGMRWLLLLVTGTIVLTVLFVVVRGIVRHPLGLFSAFLVISGGLGNIIDRARLGYVVDMFELTFMEYPVFNIADM